MKIVILLSACVLQMVFATIAYAQTETAPVSTTKRPATVNECDPSNWTIDPNVDYSYCEEGIHRND